MSVYKKLNCLILEPPKETKYIVCFLHGLGDSSDGFKDLFDHKSSSGLSMLPKGIEQNTRVVLPNAPSRNVTVNFGMKMRAWYDIYSMDRNKGIDNVEEDVNGIIESRDLILELLEEEISIVGDSKRVALGGFSQGAAMAVCAGLVTEKPLAGISANSGYTLLRNHQSHLDMMQKQQSVNGNVPILHWHGTHDQVVPYHFSLAHFEALQKVIKNPIEYHKHSSEHTVSIPQIQNISEWFGKQLQQ